jgi:hypothetical protein
LPHQPESLKKKEMIISVDLLCCYTGDQSEIFNHATFVLADSTMKAVAALGFSC